MPAHPAAQDPATLTERLGADPTTTVLCFDFDGTLSPIVEDPAAAAAAPGAADLLDGLAARFARVAVVSGRPRSFLRDRVGPTVDLSCLYGLETRTAGVEADHPEAGPWRDVIDRVAADAGGALPDGVVVESKGLSMTVHHRRAPDAADAVAAWADGVAVRTGLDVRAAKQSVELHPPLEVDKGTSVIDLVGEHAVAAYFGDDLGDLPAFAALDALRERGVETHKVAVASDGLPDEVARVADLVVDGPEALVALLAPLVAAGGR